VAERLPTGPADGNEKSERAVTSRQRKFSKNCQTGRKNWGKIERLSGPDEEAGCQKHKARGKNHRHTKRETNVHPLSSRTLTATISTNSSCHGGGEGTKQGRPGGKANRRPLQGNRAGSHEGVNRSGRVLEPGTKKKTSQKNSAEQGPNNNREKVRAVGGA